MLTFIFIGLIEFITLVKKPLADTNFQTPSRLPSILCVITVSIHCLCTCEKHLNQKWKPVRVLSGDKGKRSQLLSVTVKG